MSNTPSPWGNYQFGPNPKQQSRGLSSFPLPPPEEREEPLDNRAKVALGLGIFGLLAWCCPGLGILVGGTAILMGVMAVTTSNRTAKIMGGIGIALGAISLVLSTIILVLYITMEISAQ